MAKEPKSRRSRRRRKAPVSEHAISVSAHPRAAYSIRRAKGFGGLLGLILVGWLSWQRRRAARRRRDRARLVGGVAGYVAAWVIAVQVWRHLVIAEARAAADKLAPRLEAAAAARAGTA